MEHRIRIGEMKNFLVIPTFIVAIYAMGLLTNPVLAYDKQLVDKYKAEIELTVSKCMSELPNTQNYRLKIFELVREAKNAEILELLADQFSDDRTLRCINEGQSKSVVFSLQNRGYIYLDRALLEQQEQEKREAEAARKLHLLELARRTRDACFELEKRDPTAAYTNAICQEIFQISMPNWPTK